MKTFVVRRQEANTPLYTNSQLQEDGLDHVLEILLSEQSLTLVTHHQNIYKGLILSYGVEYLRSTIIYALDPDIKLLFQKGLLTFQTLSSLDRKKAEEYSAAGVYLHVIYELKQPNVYWLYVGAAIDVENRVTKHQCFRRAPSRDSLLYPLWNQKSRSDFCVLLGGFSNVHLLKQDQVAVNNLLEEFGCQVFQTLPKAVLQRALPENMDIIQPGLHLNRMYRHCVRCIISNRMTRNDPEKAAELAESAHELSESSDPEVAAYFQQHKYIQEPRVVAQKGSAEAWTHAPKSDSLCCDDSREKAVPYKVPFPPTFAESRI